MILMTQEIKNQLLESSYYPKEEDWMETTVIVKYFYPAGAATWLITGEEEVDGDWMLFGYVTLGYEWEWGSVLLSELENFSGFAGLKIERDLYCNGASVKELVQY